MNSSNIYTNLKELENIYLENFQNFTVAKNLFQNYLIYDKENQKDLGINFESAKSLFIKFLENHKIHDKTENNILKEEDSIKYKKIFKFKNQKFKEYSDNIKNNKLCNLTIAEEKIIFNLKKLKLFWQKKKIYTNTFKLVKREKNKKENEYFEINFYYNNLGK